MTKPDVGAMADSPAAADGVTRAHIINHTHWDREWFLTSVYTSRWIPALIERLEALVAANPDYHYLLDGQTLVVEDLLALEPSFEARVRRLVGDGRLQIGPYYCQPDWRLTDGELLRRNLAYGLADTRRLGGEPPPGWMVDTFGHISQSPQLHRLFGLDTVFVWRGVPELSPYLRWQGADGSVVTAVNLFGGYRNLYGITHAPEAAVPRLVAEVERLRPFYPTPDIPLFDGYDLEDDPEDPLLFYRQREDIPTSIQPLESTPARFSALVAEKAAQLPEWQGEMLSGKYGAIFPGTLTARIYLKVMAYDVTRLLLDRVEVWAALAALAGRRFAAAEYERWSRDLLQNAVHDCICGVSIDLVHEKMEYSYRRLFDAMMADAQRSLEALMGAFAPGDYALWSCPPPAEAWLTADSRLWHLRGRGIGVEPANASWPVQQAAEDARDYAWQNEYYSAIVGADGLVNCDGATLGRLVVRAEAGDTYSAETGAIIAELAPLDLPQVVARSEKHAEIGYRAAWQGERGSVDVAVRITFDPSPLIKWRLDVDGEGTGWQLELVATPVAGGPIRAGMPFDIVERAAVDRDLLPAAVPQPLGSVLLGQRELGETRLFPFQDVVSVGDLSVLARGLHGYIVDEAGDLRLPLRRAVSWLTRADLPGRIGDAGPFFYVPDARCERRVTHELAIAPNFAGEAMAPAVLGYRRPPALVRSAGGGERQALTLLNEPLLLSGMEVVEGALVAHLYNPAGTRVVLNESRRTVRGGEMTAVESKQITSLDAAQVDEAADIEPAAVSWLNAPSWRVGENAGRPDPAILAEIEKKIASLDEELAALRVGEAAGPGEKARRQHRYYVLARERAEMTLALKLNEQKVARAGALTYEALYEPDSAVAELGLKLNKLRIKRRIFDYVVQVL